MVLFLFSPFKACRFCLMIMYNEICIFSTQKTREILSKIFTTSAKYLLCARPSIDAKEKEKMTGRELGKKSGGKGPTLGTQGR